MAIPKVIGTETEFGIVQRGVEESNPIAASSMLINAFVAEHQKQIGWDFEDESPGNDARGLSGADAMAPEIETHLVNAVLTNGARYYVDHAHPELSTPECATPREVVIWDKAAERIAQLSMSAAAKILPPGQSLVVYKNNSDRKGNSYGAHENYVMDRATPFGQIVVHAMAHFITRQIFIGAGKVGSEAAGMTADQVPFQLTQRADFFEEEVGLETTLKRPIVNTRDEPHCDSTKYRRLHVICGDANLSETAILLKVGTTALVLAMVEDGYLPRQFRFRAPVATMRAVSYDMTVSQAFELDDGTSITALDVQWELLDRARKYADEHGLEVLGDEVVGAQVIDTWEQVLSGLERDPMTLASQLDWVAKYRVINGYRERHDLEWDDARLAAMDLQYHDLRPGKGLASRVGLDRITTDNEIESAIWNPPRTTRAFFRGRCLEKFGSSIVAANWDSMVFDVGGDPLRRVPMMEPLRGTADHVEPLIEQSQSAAELLQRLGQ